MNRIELRSLDGEGIKAGTSGFNAEHLFYKTLYGKGTARKENNILKNMKIVCYIPPFYKNRVLMEYNMNKALKLIFKPV